jgi:hypothetical protein
VSSLPLALILITFVLTTPSPYHFLPPQTRFFPNFCESGARPMCYTRCASQPLSWPFLHGDCPGIPSLPPTTFGAELLGGRPNVRTFVLGFFVRGLNVKNEFWRAFLADAGNLSLFGICKRWGWVNCSPVSLYLISVGFCMREIW